ncbi:MAG: sensor histidine kinase [Gaiellaceae bacterium]
MTARAGRERLAILVHEVRSPVAALAAIAETYPDRNLDRASRRSLATLVLAACHGIERVVTDATVASVRPQEVDLARLVVETAAAARLNGANVRADVEAGVPGLAADPLRLRQALDNLVSNAIAHSPPGAEVVIGLQARDADVVVSVADSGEGVPEDEQERIFEAGVRLDTGRPGSGLGLAVARAIAEAHGGDLTLESSPGAGATFTLVLPLRSP